MRAAFLYLAFINAADYVTTKILINKSSSFDAEANPYVRGLMESAHGTYPMFVAKLLPILFFGLMMFLLKVLHPERYVFRVWIWTVSVINVGITGVVLASIYTIYNI